MEPAMSMELEAEDGATRIPIAPGPRKTEVGRGTGLASSDRTVSRRHVSFQLAASSQDNPEGRPAHGAEVTPVAFDVIGKNPVLVVTRAGGKRIFRRSERGELGAGDRISLSLKNPTFLSLKSNGGGGAVDKGVLDAVQRRERRTVQRRQEREDAQERETERSDVASVNGEGEGGSTGLESKFQMPDLSQIDPVKEFGFLVRGHEFDHCPRKIRDIKDWNWFLREQKDGSDEDEYPDEPTMARTKGRGKAKRKGDDNGDEDWTGESEDEKVVAAEAAGARRPKYLTRSKDHKKHKPLPPGEEAAQRKGYGGRNRRIEEEDEEDETLGGFIVDTGEEEEEEQEGKEEEEEEEEEEEFEDEDDEDDD